MTKHKKPTGKNAKQKSDLKFTVRIEKTIPRKQVKEMFDKERKYLLESGSEDIDKLIAKRMNFEFFIDNYLDDDSFEFFYYDNGETKAHLTDFIDTALEDYVYELAADINDEQRSKK